MSKHATQNIVKGVGDELCLLIGRAVHFGTVTSVEHIADDFNKLTVRLNGTSRSIIMHQMINV